MIDFILGVAELAAYGVLGAVAVYVGSYLAARAYFAAKMRHNLDVLRRLNIGDDNKETSS